MRADGRDVTVAIASFETLPLLRIVCGAVRATAPAAEIVVVDTGSRDGSREWAAGRGWVCLETIDWPAGGAAAHAAALDRAVARASRPLFAVLDSDAIPIREDWLAALVARMGPAEACGAAKDPREVGALRRALLAWRRRGPEWTYLRPNRALYRTAAIRKKGLSFGKGARPGEALARALDVRLIPPAELDALVAHLRHATMALNPALFPGLRPRDLRAARRRIDAFLGSDLARRWEAAAGEAAG